MNRDVPSLKRRGHLKEEWIRVNTSAVCFMNLSVKILVLEDDGAFEEVLSGNLNLAGIVCELTRVDTGSGA